MYPVYTQYKEMFKGQNFVYIKKLIRKKILKIRYYIYILIYAIRLFCVVFYSYIYWDESNLGSCVLCFITYTC